MKNDAIPELLVYYFGFPHYRRAILQQLISDCGAGVAVVSGSTSRDSIDTLTRADLPELQVHPSVSFGPFAWDRGIAWPAIARKNRVVVVGPALSSLSTWVILLGRRLIGRPTFLWGQCGRLGDRSVRRRVQEIMNRLATGLLVYGEGEARAAAQMGTPNEKIHVVNNATSSNADAWNSAKSTAAFGRMRRRAAAAREQGELHLTFIGRLIADKQLMVLVDAARILSSKYSHFRLDIVGDGPQRLELEAAASDLPVVFHGWVYDLSAREAILRDTTLVVSPFHMGLVSVDSLRSGVPVLVPDNPMCGSEVEAQTIGVTALKFTAGDPTSLAQAAEKWVNSVDGIPAETFANARESELRRWDPTGVSRSILEAVGINVRSN